MRTKQKSNKAERLTQKGENGRLALGLVVTIHLHIFRWVTELFQVFVNLPNTGWQCLQKEQVTTQHVSTSELGISLICKEALTAHVFLSLCTGVKLRPAMNENIEKKLLRSKHSFATSISLRRTVALLLGSWVVQISVATQALSWCHQYFGVTDLIDGWCLGLLAHLVKSIDKKKQVGAFQLISGSRSPDLVEKFDAINVAEKLRVQETNFLRDLLRLELKKGAVANMCQRGHHTLHPNHLDVFLSRGLGRVVLFIPIFLMPKSQRKLT